MDCQRHSATLVMPIVNQATAEDYMQCEVRDKSGTHCQNNVIHKFQFNGKEVYLCSQCFANVCSGAYGIDLQLSAVASNTDFNLTPASQVKS
jgi:hypothetical protein